jgi:hypothetical protein
VIIQNYTENERAMLFALTQSPAFKILQKVIDEDRMECLAAIANEKDYGTIRELQGRILGCKALENVPKLIARFEQDQKVRKDPPKP